MAGRRPVDRVLEDSRDGAVVLRRHDEERVGRLDPLAQIAHRLRRVEAGLIEVLVVRGQEAEPVVEHDLDSCRGQLGGGAGERRVVRVRPQAA
jgi:hypothetical protein